MFHLDYSNFSYSKAVGCEYTRTPGTMATAPSIPSHIPYLVLAYTHIERKFLLPRSHPPLTASRKRNELLRPYLFGSDWARSIPVQRGRQQQRQSIMNFRVLANSSAGPPRQKQQKTSAVAENGPRYTMYENDQSQKRTRSYGLVYG